jgi:hypothetical protein
MNEKKEGLVMSNTYNDFSGLQRCGLLHGINEIFLPIIRSHLHSVEWGNKLVLADYGCSGGRNSMIMVQRLFHILNEEAKKKNEHVNLHCIMTDLPQNNFNDVFQAYKESEIAREKSIYVSCTGGSFYKQILPPETVHIACSFTSLHWLSKTDGLGAFHNPTCCYVACADPVRDAKKLADIYDIAQKDMQNFLLARKRELVPNGLLMFNCCGGEILFPTREELAQKEAIVLQQLEKKSVTLVPWKNEKVPLHPSKIGNFNNFGIILQKTRHHFKVELHPDSPQTQFLTIIPRTANHVREAISSHPELKHSFELLFCEVVNAPEPMWSGYVSGEYDLETFAQYLTAWNRGWSEMIVNEYLGNQPEQVEWFYECMKEMILKNPNGFYVESNFLYCCLRKL